MMPINVDIVGLMVSMLNSLAPYFFGLILIPIILRVIGIILSMLLSVFGVSIEDDEVSAEMSSSARNEQIRLTHQYRGGLKACPVCGYSYNPIDGVCCIACGNNMYAQSLPLPPQSNSEGKTTIALKEKD